MTTEFDQLVLQFQSSGYCVLPNVIAALDCESIRDNVSQAVDRQRQQYVNAPNNVGFTPSIINHDQSFADYLADDRVLAFVQHILGHNIRISFTSAIINERGGWHADWPFNQKNAGHLPAPYPDTVMHITTLWMLSPFRQENGGTLVLPGSHRL